MDQILNRMKTTQEVCREFGLEYAPVKKYPWKRKLNLRDLTPGVSDQKNFFRTIALIFLWGLVAAIALVCLGVTYLV